MSNLTEQDLRRIETIEGYLRQLDVCNPEYSLPQFKPYQPIDTTGGEQAPIETEDRYKVFAGENNGNFEVQILGIESAEQAIKVRDLIRKYLSTNKFNNATAHSKLP